MKICFITQYLPAVNFASSRIRSYYPSIGVKLLGKESIFGFSSGCDYYVINKRAGNELIDKLLVEQKRGAIVIYDLCDFALEPKMTEISDVITCPTQVMKDLISEVTFKPIIIWNDCIDFMLQEPIKLESRANSVGWFGNWNNAQKPLETLNNFSSRKYIISDIDKIELNYSSLLDDNYRLIQWNQSNFLDTIKHIGQSIFDVPANEKYKSENKALLSLAAGIPVLISKDSSTYNLLESYKTGLGDFSLIEPNKFLTEKEVDYQLKTAHKFMFKDRSYIAIAQQLIEICIFAKTLKK